MLNFVDHRACFFLSFSCAEVSFFVETGAFGCLLNLT